MKQSKNTRIKKLAKRVRSRSLGPITTNTVLKVNYCSACSVRLQPTTIDPPPNSVERLITSLGAKRVRCKEHGIPAHYFCLRQTEKDYVRAACSECFLEGSHRKHAYTKILTIRQRLEKLTGDIDQLPQHVQYFLEDIKDFKKNIVEQFEVRSFFITLNYLNKLFFFLILINQKEIDTFVQNMEKEIL